MVYQVSKILLEEAGSFDDNALYYYDAGHIVQKKLSLPSQNFGFDYLCRVSAERSFLRLICQH